MRLTRMRCAIAVVAICGSAGCVTVRPEAKELLADPAMHYDGEAFARRQEEHVLDNREGSSGGSTTQGGGCGCN